MWPPSALAECCGLFSRHVQRRFRNALGVPPKQLGRAIRVEEMRKKLMFDPDQSLTALAYEGGYADQAHFIRDFKDFADWTPGDFAGEMRAIRDTFMNEIKIVGQ